jgi:SAM-dependent methyltransferase
MPSNDRLNLARTAARARAGHPQRVMDSDHVWFEERNRVKAMGLVSVVLLGSAAVLGGLALLWRRMSRQRSMPCPEWMTGLLENPYMDAVAGAEMILDRASVSRGMKVVDIGSGPGRVTIPAAERVGPSGEVVAVDIQPKMLDRLRERVEAKSLGNVKLLLAGAGEGRLREGYYDRALLVTVLGEIPDREGAMAEIAKALKPGGMVSITEVLPDPHYQRQATVQRLAGRVGLQFGARYGGALAYTFNFSKPPA